MARRCSTSNPCYLARSMLEEEIWKSSVSAIGPPPWLWSYPRHHGPQAEDKRRLGRCRFWVPPNDYRVQEANQIEIMK